MIIDYGVGGSITLTRVQMGNTDTVLYSINSSVSRGGTQSQGVIAGSNEVRHYTVRSQRKSTVVAFRSLVIANLGMPAIVMDAEGRTYEAVLSSETIEVVCTKDGCSYDFEFDMLTVTENYLLQENGAGLLTESGQSLLLESAP